MGIQKRYDGTRLRNLPSFRVINPYVMKGRNESAIYYSQTIEIDSTHQFIRDYNAAGNHEEKLTLFQVILAATVRTIAMRPYLNRFVLGRYIYQRNRLVFSFIVKKELTDHGQETNAKITFSPFDTLESIVRRVRRHVEEARSEAGNASDHEIDFFVRLPRSILNLIVKGFLVLDYWGIAPKGMLELDPLYATCYVANLGSVGLDAPFHHLYEWGNASIFMVIGRPRRNGDGKLTLEIRFTIDDRITEGIYAAHALQMLRDFVQNPALLLERPEIDEATLAELNLAVIPE